MFFYNKSLQIAGFILILFLSACHHDHTHSDGHVHSSDEEGLQGHDSDDHTVKLNSAQYKNAGIDTGWLVAKNINDVVHANGYTKLDPQNMAEVSLPVRASVRSIRVIEGDYVRRGQVLATLSSLELQNMRLAQSRVKEDFDRSRIQRDYLKSEFERQKKLAQESINSAKDFEKISADLMAENERMLNLSEQTKIYDDIMKQVGNSGTGNISLRATIGGYVTEVNAKLGSTIPEGQTIFSIVDNSKMHVDLLVYEKDLSKVSIGQRVRFILTNQSDTEIGGEIYNIGKSFANETKSVAVHADIDDNNSNLIPGMYINALIDIGSATVKALPEEAIVLAEGRNFIFIIAEDDLSNDDDQFAFKRIEVKTGASQLGFVEVILLEEVPPGHKIVIKGAYYVQSHLQKSQGGGGHHH